MNTNRTTFSTVEGFAGAYGSIAIDLDVPELSGSPSQIEAAKRIRESAIQALLGQMVASPARAAKMTPLAVELLRAQLQVVVTHGTAKDWLDGSRTAAGAITTIARTYAEHVKAAVADAQKAAGR